MSVNIGETWQLRLRGEESGGRAARPHAEVFLILVNIIFVQHTISDKNSEIPKKKFWPKKIMKNSKEKRIETHSDHLDQWICMDTRSFRKQVVRREYKSRWLTSKIIWDLSYFLLCRKNMHLHWERSHNTAGDCNIRSLSWMGRVPDEIPQVLTHFLVPFFDAL